MGLASLGRRNDDRIGCCREERYGSFGHDLTAEQYACLRGEHEAGSEWLLVLDSCPAALRASCCQHCRCLYVEKV